MPRLKNVIAQTPLIPSIAIEPAIAKEDYPQNGLPIAATDAQPPNPIGTLAPKNYAHTIARSITRSRASNDPVSSSAGEVSYTYKNPENTFFIFPPEILYENNGATVDGYTFSSGDVLRTVDLALLTAYHENWDESGLDATYVTGNYAQTRTTIFMSYADQANLLNAMWYDDSGTPNALTNANFTRLNDVVPIAEVVSIPALSSGGETITKGVCNYPDIKTFGDFDSLEAEGLNEGSRAFNMRGYVVTTHKEKRDITELCTSGTVTLQLTGPVTTHTDFTFGAGNVPTTYIQNYLQLRVNDFPESGSNPTNFTTAVEIVNIEKGLNDDRYGDQDNIADFYFTGAYYELSDAEVSGNTAIDINVWGGDCHISLHTFKITDTTYSIVNDGKHGGSSSNLTEQWENSFQDGTGGAAATEEVARPIPLSANGQGIALYLESEVNGGYIDLPAAYAQAISGAFYYVVSEEGDARQSLDYKYNLAYSSQNINKSFRPIEELDKNVNSYPARIVYSDPKIISTDEEGFDRFRVANFYDQDNTYGSITKLNLSSDRLISIQENGISYIPVDSDAIETADGSSIQIRSGEIIGVPQYISTLYGGQDLRLIKDNGSSIYIPDVRRSKVLLVNAFAQNQLQFISDIGMDSFFRETFDLSTIPPEDLFSMYDPVRKEYWLGQRNGASSFTLVFNEQVQAWTSFMSEEANGNDVPYAGIRSFDDMFLIGYDANNDAALYSMYTGNVGDIFGYANVPSLTFVINPEPLVPKTFNNLNVNATDRLDQADMTVPRESALGDQNTGGMNIDISPKESTYRIKLLRDSGSGARLRGTDASLQLDWKTPDSNQVSLKSVATKYIPSRKPI